MENKMNTEPAMQTLLDGKKICAYGWSKREFIHLIEGRIVDEENKLFEFSTELDYYQLYIEPKQKVKLYQWAVQRDNGTWYANLDYYADKQSLNKARPQLPVDVIRLDYTIIEVDA